MTDTQTTESLPDRMQGAGISGFTPLSTALVQELARNGSPRSWPTA